MRATIRVFLALGLLGLVPAIASADSVVVGDFVRIQNDLTPRYGSGGPFTVDVSPYYGSVGLGDWVTFCLEMNEGFSSGSTYYVYDISDYADAGSVATPANPDPLSIATKWLYQEFRRGNIATSTTDRDELQQMIWCLEEGLSACTFTGDALTWYTQAQTKTAADIVDAVQVLNIANRSVTASEVKEGWGLSRDWKAQSMLTWTERDGGITNVPEPASLFLMGSGLVGLATMALRRRRSE